MFYLAELVVIMRERTMESETNKTWSKNTSSIKLKQRLSFVALYIAKKKMVKTELEKWEVFF